MNTRYHIFKRLKDFADKQMRKNYLKPHGGFDSCCPNCKEYEYQGNTITSTALDDDIDERMCHKCKHVWSTIFTPFGFIPTTEFKPKSPDNK